MKSTVKKRKFPGSNYISILISVLNIFVVLFSISLIATVSGDKYFKLNNINQAKLLYSVAHVANPFNKTADQRLLAANLKLNEKEEVFNENDLALSDNADKNVLGASATLPILMYHYIRVNPRGSEPSLSVSPANFKSQMDYLVSHGYHTISLDELGDVLLNHGLLPTKPIIITLDDGYTDAYETALPILQSHGFKAVEFIITGVVGAPGYLSWGQIAEMKNSGVFTFGSHTVHHYNLNKLTLSNLKSELTESKKVLQEHVGYPINWLAYPYGGVNKYVASQTQQAGYVGAVSTNYGNNLSKGNLFYLPRIRISGGDAITSFAAKIP